MLLNERPTFPPRTFPPAFLHTWTFPPSFMYDERVRGFPPRVWRRRRHAGAARLGYRRGRDRQATDAASDLLQRLTTTAAAPPFRASRCVRCRRWSRCPPGTCMSPRWTATTGQGVYTRGVVRHRVTAAKCGRGVDLTAAECTWPAAGKASEDVYPDSAASTAHHLCSKTCWLEDGERGLACDRAHSPLPVKVTVTITLFLLLDISCINIALFQRHLNWYIKRLAVYNCAYLFITITLSNMLYMLLYVRH